MVVRSVCVICHEQVVRRNQVVLPCSKPAAKHMLCRECAGKFFTDTERRPTCPICKDDIGRQFLHNNGIEVPLIESTNDDELFNRWLNSRFENERLVLAGIANARMEATAFYFQNQVVFILCAVTLGSLLVWGNVDGLFSMLKWLAFLVVTTVTSIIFISLSTNKVIAACGTKVQKSALAIGNWIVSFPRRN